MATRQRSSGGIADGLGTGSYLVIGGGILTVVSVVLPWLEFSTGGGSSSFGATTTSASANGLDMMDMSIIFSGAVTALLALVAVGLAIAASRNKNGRIGEIVLGGIVAVVGIIYIVSPSTAMGGGAGAQFVTALVNPSASFGVFLTILGGLLIAGGGALGFSNSGSRSPRRSQRAR
jgi:hypothetical protein